MSFFRRPNKAVRRVWTRTAVGCLVLSIAGCVDPAETAKRGAEELARHRNSPVLTAPISALPLVSSSDTAAYAVEQDPTFPSSYPTTFLRKYDLLAYTPEQLFSAYKAHLESNGLRLTHITCRVSDRTEVRTWGGVLLGDSVSAAVSVSPGFRRIELALRIDSGSSRLPATGEPSAVGLSNCLTVRLPASAYVPRFAELRTAEELCIAVRAAVPDATVNPPANGVQTCTLTLAERRSAKVTLTVEDLRTSTITAMLNVALPRTEPSAAFYITGSRTTCSVTMMTLPDGALRLNANDATVCAEIADAWPGAASGG